MRVILSIFLTLFLFSFENTCACTSGAGGLLYTKIQGTIYVLLADHKKNDRGWASFGGKIDGESDIIAAAREIEEETKGLIKRDWALSNLKNSPSYTDREGDCYYTMFFLEIPYKPAIQFTSSLPPNTLKDSDERGPYSWVPLSVVKEALKQFSSGADNKVTMPPDFLPYCKRSTHYWNVFLKSLNNAEKHNALPPQW